MRFDTKKRNEGLCIYKLTITLLALVFLAACHPPVDNYLSQSQRNTLSWVGAPAAELILLKGNPHKISYLGQDLRAMVESEYWNQEQDRLTPMYRTFGPKRSRLPQQLNVRDIQVYQQLNTLGPWLYTYRYPVRDYRSLIRMCIEYYVIGSNAKIVDSSFVATNINDYKHCPLPTSRPSVQLSKLRN